MTSIENLNVHDRIKVLVQKIQVLSALVPLNNPPILERGLTLEELRNASKAYNDLLQAEDELFNIK